MLKKIIGIILLGIAFILGSIWLWLCVFGISLKPMEDKIQQAVSQNLQAHVSFYDARLKLGSEITLVITDLSLSHSSPEFQGETFLKVPKISLGLNLFSLWKHQIEPEIFVESPELFLFKDNNLWALTTLSKTITPKTTTPQIPSPQNSQTPGLPPEWLFLLKNFDLANGKIFLAGKEQSQKTPAPVTKINFQVQFFTPEDFKGSFNLDDISIAQLMTLVPSNPAQKIITMASGSLESKFQGSTIDPNKIKDTLNMDGTLILNDVKFHGDAAKNVLEEQSSALKILSMQPRNQTWPQWTIPFSLHQGVFQFEQNISFYEGNFSLKPNVFLKENNRLAGPVSFESTQGAWLGFTVRGELKGDLANPGVSIDAASLQSEALKRGLQSTASNLKGKAQKELEKRPQIQQKLQKYGIDVRKFLDR